MQLSQLHCQVVLLQYSTCPLWSNYSTHMHSVMITQLHIFNHTKCTTYNYRSSAGLYIELEYSAYHITILINNSHFHVMDRTALIIKSRYSPHTVQKFFITNCTFKSIDTGYAIYITVSPSNKHVYFVNCDFQNNKEVIIINIKVCRSHACFSSTKLPVILTNICFIRCHFISNSHGLIIIENRVALLGKIHLLLESLTICFHNYNIRHIIKNLILVSAANVHINGTFNVTKNHCRLSIMQFQLCDILFSGNIIFDNNYCAEVLSLDAYIKVLEYTNIAIINNRYQNALISLNSAVGYYQPHAFCLFQYVATKVTNNTLTNYAISFLHNHKTLNLNNFIFNFNGSLQTDNCSVSICHFLSHCKWLSSSAFHNQDPEVVNKQIIQNDEQNCNYHKHICYCNKNREINCSKDILGAVYPGQKLQTYLCQMCSNDNRTVLYAEVHNVNLPTSSCKIAHQSQLINVIGNHSHTVNYTIVSSTPDSDRCELFLTASPFLNKIYDAFYVATTVTLSSWIYSTRWSV